MALRSSNTTSQGERLFAFFFVFNSPVFPLIQGVLPKFVVEPTPGFFHLLANRPSAGIILRPTFTIVLLLFVLLPGATRYRETKLSSPATYSSPLISSYKLDDRREERAGRE